MIHYLPDKKTDAVDVLLVSGDAYIDCPSFGIAIIARVIEFAGFSVCIVSQPEYYIDSYLETLPEVKLFIGITSGNMDSVVSNYTSSRNIRKTDDFSLDGEPYFENGARKRPDRATIFYTSYFKKRYKNVPVVLGGIEASLRRAAHYDYVQQKIRKSILIDSKADIIVYSMGEKAIVEIAKRLSSGLSLDGVRGTAVKKKNIDDLGKFIELPSYNDILKDKSLLIKTTSIMEENMVWDKSDILVQKQDNEYVVVYPPNAPLSRSELDEVYSLPYRKDYPDYCERIPAWRMIKDSIVSHRGCFGRCSFCAITLHQGPIVTSRSLSSIEREIANLSELKSFHGTITDVGGPTANMYGLSCKIGWCKSPSCLYPQICPNLEINDDYLIALKFLKRRFPEFKIFVGSGLRHDLSLKKTKETEWIIKNATSGRLKIAPEHTDDKILKLMKKPPNAAFEKFLRLFDKIKKDNNLKYQIIPYIILSFPGSSLDSVKKLGAFLKKNGVKSLRHQDFTPTPATLATAMFYAERDCDGNEISAPRLSSKNNPQREILEKLLK
ncbi:MAG TPA: YgiQ family radical SAM protein [Spirochaetota bacterium]|jgi:uncharacterized radical SAM protein YgiQ|nr:MAG: hypothetical protein BWX91_00545 [Spirochaetes bacterium ADurb.Bin133]HNZ27839.1 YgiQ family radical SAM protein [Spirochaetota bacterium]HPY87153.1 YgiQ family radical SAM protein [Spirochaetota bacterium]HQB60479.1 YgiQ family radical SAM protein [Spirochaetota bacterium]